MIEVRDVRDREAVGALRVTPGQGGSCLARAARARHRRRCLSGPHVRATRPATAALTTPAGEGGPVGCRHGEEVVLRLPLRC